MSRHLSKNGKLLTHLSLILFGFILFSLIYNAAFSDKIHGDIDSISNEESLADIYPKQSGQEINITTPENKTYKEPMSGFYPAIYGFENDKSGEDPKEWTTDHGDGNSFVEVDGSLAGHNKVVEIKKNGGITKAYIYNQFVNNQTVGTVEFWLYKDTNDTTDVTQMFIEGDGGEIIFGFANKDLYRDLYMTRTDMAFDIFEQDIWYHIRVDFDIAQSGWQIQVGSTWYGTGYSLPFRNSPTKFEGFSVNSAFSGCHPNYSAYVDAVGYSWDPNYNIGDNLNEGLLLSFNNNTNLDWIGYSLDGQSNKTILGNTTIPMPNDGLHTIRVSGNNTSGTKYQADVIYFTIKTSEDSNGTGDDDNDEGENIIIIIIIIIIISTLIGISIPMAYITIKKRKSKEVVHRKIKGYKVIQDGIKELPPSDLAKRVEEKRKALIKTKQLKREKIGDYLQRTDGSEKILNILSQEIPLAEMKELKITTLSDDFIKKLNKLEMRVKVKRKFIEEMLTLTPKERHEIIDTLLEIDFDDFLR